MAEPATPLDWRHAYQQRQRHVGEHLRVARRRGDTFYRPGDAGVPVNPSRMTDRQIDDLARRDAERIVNAAIIKHNETT